MKKAFLSLLLTLLVFLSACGGGSTSGDIQPLQLKLNTTTASSLVGQTAQFSANVPVTWAVTETNGGSITSGGLYTAPRNVGTFHVVATTVSNTSESATAIVNVSAKFAHVQEIPSGATPLSVTPILNTIAPDGTITSANFIDTSTNKPIDTQMEDVALSPDGTLAVFTMVTTDASLNTQYQAVWIANTDGSGPRQLTYPTTPTDWAADRYPSFTPDGKSVIFTRQDSNEGTSGYMSYSIQVIGADGTNAQVLFAGNPSVATGLSVANPYVWHAALSPDGTSIATEMAYSTNGDWSNWVDGIATMSTSGPTVKQLTGYATNYSCASGWGYDELPTYTHDGASIIFARICDTETSVTETIMSMDAAGSIPTQLHGAAGLMSFEPRAIADKIAFSSNVDNPATDWFDIYLMNTDGSNLKRVTNNTLYDGFSIWWMSENWNDSTASARAVKQGKRMSPMQQRLDHVKQVREHRKRR